MPAWMTRGAARGKPHGIHFARMIANLRSRSSIGNFGQMGIIDGMKRRRTLFNAVLVFSTALITLGCAPGLIEDPPFLFEDGESTAKRAFAYKTTTTMVGDWKELPDFRQCYTGMYDFYLAKFNVGIPFPPNAYTGTCAPLGACHLWLDGIPDANVWERHEAGSGEPTTYDMIIYPPTKYNEYGHVAGVDHVEDGLIYVMDTNFMNDERRSDTPHTVGWGEYGWYHLRSAPLDPGQVGACAGLANGLYCGGNKVTGDSNTLYRCINGNLSVVNECPSGCKPMPDNDDDQCFTEAGGGNASACAGVADGKYCGGDTIVGDAATLYECASGALSVVSECQYGCQVNAPGTDDQCKSQSGGGGGCSGAANGYYCGNNGVSGDTNTLYHCSNGTLSVAEVCQYGCQPMAAGTDDACKTGGGGGGCSGAANGYYCGGNGVSGDANTLYQCSNGTLSVAEVCQYGCQPMAAGTDDVCKSSGGGGSMSCAGAASGYYCGGNGVSGNANTLYLCSSGVLTVVQVCANGCQPMPAGYDDKCK